MPRHSRAWRYATLLMFVLLPPTIRAATESDPVAAAIHDLLSREAAAPERQVSVTVTPESAHLPPCVAPQPFLPHAQQRLPGRVAVGVRCADGTTRYRRASVAISAPYPVARRALAAGEILTADMLELRHGDLGRLPRQALLDASQAIGRELTRGLAEGSPLPANALRAVPLVSRGARVRVEARSGSFVASREGSALDHGGLGEEVRVRTESGSILRARVRGQNLLSVDF